MNTDNLKYTLDDIEIALKKLIEYINSGKSVDIIEKELVQNLEKYFNEFEQENIKEMMLEKKANNLMHDLEEEMKKLLIKHRNLEKFETQVNEHFKILADTKVKAINAIKDKRHGSEVILNNFKKTANFIGKELDEEMKIKYDVQKELNEAVEKLNKIKSHMINRSKFL